jgi:hypothetical protein
VIEKVDKTEQLHQEERLGYHSVHYVVALGDGRRGLPEYARYDGLLVEIQVRTVLQHAWAEIEHDIQYKARTALPSEIRRRFITLAGLLEIADREFQDIQTESDLRLTAARASLAAGRLEEVEITPDSLKAYLDRHYGPDGRMRDFSYQWTSRLLRRLGFQSLEQLDLAISPYDDDQISRIVHGGRQGQLTRLEAVLLAALGDEYIVDHPWTRSDDHWYRDMLDGWLAKLRAADLPTGTYSLRGLQNEVLGS